MKIYYSATSAGFFSDDIHGPRTILVPDPSWKAPEGETGDAVSLVELSNPDTQIPTDAVEITEQEHQELMEGHNNGGKAIIAGPDGRPILADRPPPPINEQWQLLRYKRDVALSSTDGLVARHRDQVERSGNTTLTAASYKNLQAARQLLRDLPGSVTDPAKAVWPDLSSWLPEAK